MKKITGRQLLFRLFVFFVVCYVGALLTRPAKAMTATHRDKTMVVFGMNYAVCFAKHVIDNTKTPIMTQDDLTKAAKDLEKNKELYDAIHFLCHDEATRIASTIEF